MVRRIGALELGTLPRVAVPLSDNEIRDRGGRAAWLADVFELRVDQFERPDAATLADALSLARLHQRPALVTVRDPAEGGVRALPDRVRLDLYRRAIEAGASGVDVELRASIRDDVCREAAARGCTVILSVHDFHKTPPKRELLRAIDQGRDAGADIVKIACLAGSTADLAVLLDVLRERRRQGLIVIAMGEAGRASRVFFPLVGSLLTYGCLERANAPGQLTAEELVRELTAYHPAYRENRRIRRVPAGRDR